VGMTSERMRNLRSQAANYIRTRAVPNMQSAKVQSSVEPLGDTPGRTFYEIVTVETNAQIVQTGILGVLRDRLEIEDVVSYRLAEDPSLTLDRFFVVEDEDRYLSDVVGGSWNYDIHRFKGGVAVLAEQLDPPLTVEEFDSRLKRIRLLPEYETAQSRDHGLFPLSEPRKRADGREAYDRFVVLAVDDAMPYSAEESDRWVDLVARSEARQVEAALGTSKTLRKVVQFAPQVASAAKQDAMAAIVLSFLAIMGYVWVRYGAVDYGLAAIVATFHDIAFTLGALAFSHILGNSSLGKAIGVFPFKVDLSMVAAILTIIGYSINDKIVIFDRIRENRGRGEVNVGLLNKSINDTLSRTILTGGTVLIMIMFLYVMGGEGIRGFCYAFLIGVVVGTYSSIAVGAPLLYLVKELYIVSKVLAGLLASGMAIAYFDSTAGRLVSVGMIIALVVIWIVRAKTRVTPRRSLAASAA